MCSCPAARIRQSSRFFVWLVPQAESRLVQRLTFHQPAILLLFHFNLTSSFRTCSYPLWSPLHFCYSCQTFAPHQYHFALLLQDGPAHHFDAIHHLYLNWKTMRIHMHWNSEHFYSNARNGGLTDEKHWILIIMAQNSSHIVQGSLNAIMDFSKRDLGGCRICAT